MKINEVEKLLGVPMATIRFYEKEGLLFPQRNENPYRDYAEKDVQLLKRIIVLRKIGISVEEIKRILEGTLSLQEALEKNILSLQEKIKELEGAVKLCMEMREKDVKDSDFDIDYYWDVIHREEQDGNRFPEIMNDVIVYEKRLLGDEFDLFDEEGKQKYSRSDSIVIIAGICVLSGLLWSALNGMTGISFFQGLFFPFLWILIKSALGLPLLLWNKKPENAAKAARRLWQIFIVLFLAAAVIIKVFCR